MGGAGPIPWTAIHTYAEAHGIEEFTYFEEVIGAMDRAYLAHQRRQEEDTGNE
jgi:hypothetical protein